MKLPPAVRARSGTRFLDTISAIIAPAFAGDTRRRWRIGDQGIVLLHNMMNDACRVAGGDQDYLNAYEKALCLALGVFGARSFIHADQASRVGVGWRVKGYSRLENGRTWFTRTHGDTGPQPLDPGRMAHPGPERCCRRGTKTLTLRKVDNTTAAVWVQGVYLTAGRVVPVPPKHSWHVVHC